MSITSPHYQIEVPSPATRFKDLGAELQQFGLDVDRILSEFDYNGADPNLLLSRVVALETAVAALTYPEWRAIRSFPPAGQEAGHTMEVTFPAGRFGVPPAVQLTKMESIAAKFIPYAVNVTTAGFTLGLYIGDGTQGGIGRAMPIAIHAYEVE